MGVSGGHTHLHHYPRTMSFSLFGLNSASKAQFNGKTAARTKAMLAAAVVSLGGLGLMLPGQASASCYGTGYTRYCNGVGGLGSTYSKRGNFGRTTYYNSNGHGGSGSSRTQTYRTYSY